MRAGWLQRRTDSWQLASTATGQHSCTASGPSSLSFPARLSQGRPMLLLPGNGLLECCQIMSCDSVGHWIEPKGRQKAPVGTLQLAVGFIHAQLGDHRVRGDTNLLELALGGGFGGITGMHQNLLI